MSTSSFELYFGKNRTLSEATVLYQADGTGLTLNAGDKVRFKVYRRDQATPILDLDNIGAISGGSIVTVTQTASAAMVTIKVCQADIASVDPGCYSAELAVVDSGDSNLIKDAMMGVVHFYGTGGGDIGAT